MVNLYLFYWSVRTSKIKILWSIRTFSIGQFGPFPLVNLDLRITKKTAFRLKTSHPVVLYDGLAFHKVKLRFALINVIHQRIVNYITQSTLEKETDGLLESTDKAYSLLTGRLIIGLPLKMSLPRKSG